MGPKWAFHAGICEGFTGIVQHGTIWAFRVDVRGALTGAGALLILIHPGGCMFMFPDDWRPDQRAALLAWWLAHGERLDVRQARKLVGLQRKSALTLLRQLAEVLPIHSDGDTWYADARSGTDGCDNAGGRV